MRLAFIVQRYGAEVLGGAEYLCRLVAERLAARHQVEVLTTCARDYVTWKNEYPEGADRIRGVTVRRFAVARTRDLESFNRFSAWIFNNPHSRQDEIEWLRQQGPWSPALVDYLQRQHQAYDVLVFFTYLYAPTVLGLRVDPARSILVPTAHDEPAIRLEIFKEVFGLPAGIAYLTEAERRFVRSRFRLRALVEDVIGVGVDLPPAERALGEPPPAPPPIELEGEIPVEVPADAAEEEPLFDEESPSFRRHLAVRGAAFRRRYRLHGPIVLYGGRIDPGKGCEELIEYFGTYVARGGEGTLVLMGAKLMPLPEEPWIRFAGRLPDQDRFQALEAATVVVAPSPYESLSLLALEAFAAGTPVLANARSAVLVEHCRKSNAGLWYGDREEFVEALSLLVGNDRLRAAMGRTAHVAVGLDQHR